MNMHIEHAYRACITACRGGSLEVEGSGGAWHPTRQFWHDSIGTAHLLSIGSIRTFRKLHLTL